MKKINILHILLLAVLILFNTVNGYVEFDEEALLAKPPEKWTIDEIMSIPPDIIDEVTRKQLIGVKLMKSLFASDPNDQDSDPRIGNAFARLGDAFQPFAYI